jgi:hypothetical protein
MARLTDIGAFTGASARLPRNRAELPGVVGPVAGNDAAKLAEATPKVSAAVKTSPRTAVLKFISIYECAFLKNPRHLASKFLPESH